MPTQNDDFGYDTLMIDGFLDSAEHAFPINEERLIMEGTYRFVFIEIYDPHPTICP